ncbi:hypothetical protein EPD60_14790 [Flaviaesturariibacter flavus]|uniref:Uncharacterized protein n=1 Tax=Flaviaesturariibacter flavus TaxID=2502780 RepID=A0A4V2NV85_9BACT|nr:hypothetical protein [Flaviaesturariibacter flavus]TCJ12536.1 hypothetical protein EPD60_14790 [Flaviaesturariibacter flavus]
MRLPLLSALFLATMASCQERQAPVVASSGSASKAIKEPASNSRLYSKGREEQLIERLYNEQVEAESGLKKLEQELQDLYQRRGDSTRATTEFIAINKQYYDEAAGYASPIRDSQLRLQISRRLEESLKGFDSKKAQLEAWLGSIDRNNASIGDLHRALKVLVTLSMMERFQRTDEPPMAPMQHYVADQEMLMRQLRDSVNKK